VQVDDILDPAAVDLLAARLRTPSQSEQHLTLATGHQASEKPVGKGIVDSVLSKQIDDREPTLTRHGYTGKGLAELLDTKLGEVMAMFRQTLGAERSRELKEQRLAGGLPDRMNPRTEQGRPMSALQGKVVAITGASGGIGCSAEGASDEEKAHHPGSVLARGRRAPRPV
jgi:hypothetical protein